MKDIKEEPKYISIDPSPINETMKESYKFQTIAWIYIFVVLIINFCLILFLSIK